MAGRRDQGSLTTHAQTGSPKVKPIRCAAMNMAYGGHLAMVDGPPTRSAIERSGSQLAEKDSRPMIKSVVFALTLAAFGGSAMTAYAATQAEKAACQSDALKYCS